MILQRKRIIFYVLTLLLSGFILLTAFISFFPESMLDREFSEEVQEHQHPLVDTLMKAISFPGQRPYSIIMIVLTSFSFLLFRFKKEALFMLFTSFSGLISHSLKILIDRPRPTDSFVRIIEKAEHQSFPSGHVLFYVIFFGFLVVLMYHLEAIPKTIRLSISGVALFLIFTVPLSRIYLGAHWFTDVTAAFLLGLVCLFFLSYFYLKKQA
ncbi:phosphatase PAP2 family protein [Desertivirga xinjiangensis]|uniref:phosphatase PAP2 family protein n=1 Tax=Desertivirga xinjiangensis TaxID=539206 RepID=UPI00210A1941|nr:phosphatase PAP2 family protein [Pedobacter xinjiangensis]